MQNKMSITNVSLIENRAAKFTTTMSQFLAGYAVDRPDFLLSVNGNAPEVTTKASVVKFAREQFDAVSVKLISSTIDLLKPVVVPEVTFAKALATCDCGTEIKSEKTLEFAIKLHGKAMCYPCQQKARTAKSETKATRETVATCTSCSTSIFSADVVSYSVRKMKKVLCMKCQKAHAPAEPTVAEGASEASAPQPQQAPATKPANNKFAAKGIGVSVTSVASNDTESVTVATEQASVASAPVAKVKRSRKASSK